MPTKVVPHLPALPFRKWSDIYLPALSLLRLTAAAYTSQASTCIATDLNSTTPSSSQTDTLPTTYTNQAEQALSGKWSDIYYTVLQTEWGQNTVTLNKSQQEFRLMHGIAINCIHCHTPTPLVLLSSDLCRIRCETT